MSRAAARVMLLALWRDRAGLAMAFLLPPLMFLVFAVIMDGSNGSNLQLKLAAIDASEDGSGARLIAALDEDPALDVVDSDAADRAALEQLVARDIVDAAVLVRAPLSAEEGPVVLIVDPAKANSASVLEGQVRRIIAEALPDVMVARNLVATEALIGGFSPAQAAQADAAVAALRAEDEPTADIDPAADGGADATDEEADLVTTRSIDANAPGAVVYYAGAIAIMSLLFTASNSALALIDERDSGVIERLAVYPGAMDALVMGKFIFITALGLVQTTMIFVVAGVIYGVDALANPAAWALTSLAAAAFAAAFALLIAAASSSKQQAGSVANFTILVFSAVGGSMVPRYFMAPWLQDLGWFTPNAWIIEAYRSAVGRGAPIESFIGSWGVMAAAAAASLALAVMFARRAEAVRPA